MTLTLTLTLRAVLFIFECYCLKLMHFLCNLIHSTLQYAFMLLHCKCYPAVCKCYSNFFGMSINKMYSIFNCMKCNFSPICLVSVTNLWIWSRNVSISMIACFVTTVAIHFAGCVVHRVANSVRQKYETSLPLSLSPFPSPLSFPSPSFSSPPLPLEVGPHKCS